MARDLRAEGAELDRVRRIHPVTAVQSELSLWTRDYVEDVVPWCAANGASFVAFSPLGRGFLTGAIEADREFGPEDFRSTLPRFTREAVAQNQRIVEAVKAVAERRGATPAQIALAWVLARGEHVVAIPGTRREKYLEQNVAAAEIVLTPKELARARRGAGAGRGEVLGARPRPYSHPARRDDPRASVEGSPVVGAGA